MEKVFFESWGDSWLFFLILLVGLSLFGPELSPHTYYAINLVDKNQPPSGHNWFGTDELGRDLFVRCCWGGRVSFFVGLIASLIDLLIGVIVGAISGFSSRKIDTWIMRGLDVLSSIPYLLIVILLTVVMGSGLFSMIVALTLTGWLNMSRIVRSQVLKIRQQDYILAAKGYGATFFRIILRYLIPNIMGTITATLTVTISAAIFAEAFLSFLGLGVQAPIASWGTMANDGLATLRYYPWRLFFPASLICLTLLSLNLIADSLRDTFDPRSTP